MNEWGKDEFMETFWAFLAYCTEKSQKPKLAIMVDVINYIQFTLDVVDPTLTKELLQLSCDTCGKYHDEDFLDKQNQILKKIAADLIKKYGDLPHDQPPGGA